MRRGNCFTLLGAVTVGLAACGSIPERGPYIDPEAFAASRWLPTPRTLEERRTVTEGDSFARTDLDEDGRLSLSEYRANTWLLYARYDADRSGNLSLEEYLYKECGAFPEPPRQWCLNSDTKAFRRLAKGAPTITAASIESVVRDSFAYNDLNYDGWVTREEQREAGPGCRRYRP